MKQIYKPLCFFSILAFSNASYALSEGQCVTTQGTITAGKSIDFQFEDDGDGAGSKLNDSLGQQDIIETSSNDRIGVNNNGFYNLFCRCATATDSMSLNYKGVVDGNHALTQTYDGELYTFYDVDVDFPFYVGATIAITGHKPVPNVYTQQTFTCNANSELNGEVGGEKVDKDHEGGLAKLIFRRKEDTPAAPGLYEFTFPTISVYIVHSNESAETLNYSGTPATQFNFNVIRAYIYNSCEMSSPDIFTVDLGAVSSADFTTDDEKPVDYEKRNINLAFTCGGTVDDQVDFYITDGLLPANTGTYLTTNLEGLGVAIDVENMTTPGRVDLDSRYIKQIPLSNNQGQLQLQVYPVKIPGIDIETGIYRAKANIIIENY